MSSKPQHDSQSNSSKKSSAADSSKRKPMPFEPTSHRKQAGKQASPKETKPTKPTIAAAKVENKSSSTSSKGSTSGGSAAIPDVVSRRMVRRMALFCGIPTALGMSSFVVSYLVVSHDLIKLPTTVVLLVSLGFFGLGVLGLSYGVLSASWDETVPGSQLGWSEFKANWKRITDARRSEKS